MSRANEERKSNGGRREIESMFFYTLILPVKFAKAGSDINSNQSPMTRGPYSSHPLLQREHKKWRTKSTQVYGPNLSLFEIPLRTRYIPLLFYCW